MGAYVIVCADDIEHSGIAREWESVQLLAAQVLDSSGCLDCGPHHVVEVSERQRILIAGLFISWACVLIPLAILFVWELLHDSDIFRRLRDLTGIGEDDPATWQQEPETPVHVLPGSGFLEHEISEDCPCGPTRSDNAVIHRPMPVRIGQTHFS